MFAGLCTLRGRLDATTTRSATVLVGRRSDTIRIVGRIAPLLEEDRVVEDQIASPTTLASVDEVNLSATQISRIAEYHSHIGSNGLGVARCILTGTEEAKLLGQDVVAEGLGSARNDGNRSAHIRKATVGQRGRNFSLENEGIVGGVLDDKIDVAQAPISVLEVPVHLSDIGTK